MTGNNFRVIITIDMILSKGIDKSIHTSTAAEINVRITITHEGITGVNNIGFFKLNDHITIGVANIKVMKHYILIIQYENSVYRKT